MRAIQCAALAVVACAFNTHAAALGSPITVYRNGSENYHTFRIPNVLITATGRLIMFAEGRVRDGFTPPPPSNISCCYGYGASVYDDRCTDKDIVSKVSDDGGLTWSAAVLIPSTAANDTVFYSNPSGLAEPASTQWPQGRVFLTFARCQAAQYFANCTHVIYVSSNDGDTWSPLQETACSITIGGVSGGIITPTGRYIFPDQGRGVLYSDAQGAAGSWMCGKPSSIGGENMVAVLADGQRLIMTIRGGLRRRAFAYSTDDGSTWGNAVISDVDDPNCQGSMIAVNSSSYFLLFANPHTNITTPAPDPYGRQNVTVQRSDDDGSSWYPLLQATDLPSAYTSMIQLNSTACAIVWEESDDWPVDFTRIQFLAFDCATGATGRI